MRARPQVSTTTPLSREAVLAAFQAELAAPHAPCEGYVGRGEVSLHVAAGHRKWWSPWLQLSVQEQAQGCLLTGTMGPAPELWTGFVFVYSSCLVAVVGGILYGAIGYNIQIDTLGFPAAGLGLLGLALSCSADLIGRRLSAAQMGIIRGFVDRSLDVRGATPS